MISSRLMPKTLQMLFKKMKKQITYLDYDKVQICTGTILAASINEKGKKTCICFKN